MSEETAEKSWKDSLPAVTQPLEAQYWSEDQIPPMFVDGWGELRYDVPIVAGAYFLSQWISKIVILRDTQLLGELGSVPLKDLYYGRNIRSFFGTEEVNASVALHDGLVTFTLSNKVLPPGATEPAGMGNEIRREITWTFFELLGARLLSWNITEMDRAANGDLAVRTLGLTYPEDGVDADGLAGQLFASTLQSQENIPADTKELYLRLTDDKDAGQNGNEVSYRKLGRVQQGMDVGVYESTVLFPNLSASPNEFHYTEPVQGAADIVSIFTFPRKPVFAHRFMLESTPDRLVNRILRTVPVDLSLMNEPDDAE